jgi:hypothetical protein
MSKPVRKKPENLKRIGYTEWNTECFRIYKSMDIEGHRIEMKDEKDFICRFENLYRWEIK